MEVEVRILTKKESKTYSDRGILISLFTINKVNHDFSKEFIMSFEMTHLLKRKSFPATIH
ncbi:MAG: hypothetical protein ACW97V_19180 [Promethearchaeota archaeon]